LAVAASEPNDIIGSIRTQLEGLKRTEDGMLLYRLIERGLGKRPEQAGDTDEAFLTFLYTLLERYAKNRDGDPITRIKVRVIQQRITPHLLAADEEVPAAAPVAESEPVSEEAAPVAAEPEKTEAVVVAPEPVEDESGEVTPEEISEPEFVEEEAPSLELDVPKANPAVETALPELELTDEMKFSMDEEQRAPKQVTPKKAPPDKPKAEPIQSEKKKAEPVTEAKPKAKPVAKEAEAPKKPEPKPELPRKPIKLELVEPTDLTRPHVAPIPRKEEEYDIELGGDAPQPAAGKSAASKSKAKSPTRVPQKAPDKPVAPRPSTEKKPLKAKGELVPKEVVPPAPGKNRKPDGPPSQERVEKLHEAFVHKMAESITRSQVPSPAALAHESHRACR